MDPYAEYIPETYYYCQERYPSLLPPSFLPVFLAASLVRVVRVGFGFGAKTHMIILYRHTSSLHPHCMDGVSPGWPRPKFRVRGGHPGWPRPIGDSEGSHHATSRHITSRCTRWDKRRKHHQEKPASQPNTQTDGRLEKVNVGGGGEQEKTILQLFEL